MLVGLRCHIRASTDEISISPTVDSSQKKKTKRTPVVWRQPKNSRFCGPTTSENLPKNQGPAWCPTLFRLIRHFLVHHSTASAAAFGPEVRKIITIVFICFNRYHTISYIIMITSSTSLNNDQTNPKFMYMLIYTYKSGRTSSNF